MAWQQDVPHDTLNLPGLRDLAGSLVNLLEIARRELERDRHAAQGALARALSLLQIELDRSGQHPVRKEASGGLTGWQIQRVRNFIEEHLEDDIHLKDLSEVAQRSPGHFLRAFKQTLGETPHAYVVRRRLDRAGRLMLESDAALSEIALTCGFADQAHFCRQFRQSTGQSPAAWRRERCDAVRFDPPSCAASAP
ncbi:MAG: AraC family transcriptional regulator [Aliidongia sp.]